MRLHRSTRLRILASAFLSGVALAVLGLPAQAAGSDDDWQITRWDQTLVITPDGGIEVTIDMDFDFGDTPGRGPRLYIPTQQPYDDSHLRIYQVSGIRAESSTGASAQLHITDGEGAKDIRIGDAGTPVLTGVHSYVISYRIDHVMNDVTDADPDGDGAPQRGSELYWNVIGDGWTIPIHNATFRVESPGEPLGIACYFGWRGSGDACDGWFVDGNTVVFHQDSLRPGQMLSVNVLYPPGTADGTPMLKERHTAKAAFSLTPWTIGGFLAIVVIGTVIALRRFNATARDVQYAGAAPGFGPAFGETASSSRRRKDEPVPMQFRPPAGMRPGQLGTLLDERADPRDVTATIIDLAVRGYLSIKPVIGKGTAEEPGDYTLERVRALDDELEDYERSLLIAILPPGKKRVALSHVKPELAAAMSGVQDELYESVTRRGWFMRNPKHARQVWWSVGVTLVVVGLILTLLLAFISRFGLIPLGLIIVGTIVCALAPHAPARTADGTAALLQAQGFEQYLRSAEGDQLRSEEDSDLFSRYLPYAIAFGIEKEWADRFTALAASGVSLPEPSWYSANLMAGGFWLNSHHFGSQIANFASTSDSALSAPVLTPGSSGSSGFSGGYSGGGFSGGGGGGGW